MEYVDIPEAMQNKRFEQASSWQSTVLLILFFE